MVAFRVDTWGGLQRQARPFGGGGIRVRIPALGTFSLSASLRLEVLNENRGQVVLEERYSKSRGQCLA